MVNIYFFKEEVGVQTEQTEESEAVLLRDWRELTSTSWGNDSIRKEKKPH